MGGNEGYLSSLKDCLRWRRGEQSGGSGEPEPFSAHLSHHWDRASQRERQDTLGEQELAKAREAHWQALVAATAVLEEQIERLSLINYQNKARCLPPFPKLRPAKKKVPRDRAKGTVGPCQKKAAKPWSPTCSLTGSPQQCHLPGPRNNI